VNGLDEWQLLNLPSQILDLLDETKKNGTFAKALAASARGRGAGGGSSQDDRPADASLLVGKGGRYLGIGLDSMVNVRSTRSTASTSMHYVRCSMTALQEGPVLSLVRSWNNRRGAITTSLRS